VWTDHTDSYGVTWTFFDLRGGRGFPRDLVGCSSSGGDINLDRRAWRLLYEQLRGLVVVVPVGSGARWRPRGTIGWRWCSS
jgi:hypothetical protein